MTKEYDNVLAARNIVKEHIDFLKLLLSQLKIPSKTLRARAGWTVWCIDRYLNEKLILDVQDAIENTFRGNQNVN